ncbi:MAG: glycosyltransferase [Chloroflexota bacterium]
MKGESQKGEEKRVAIIGPVYPYRGGIAQYTDFLCRALEAESDILLISYSRQYPNFLFPGESDKEPTSQTNKQQSDLAVQPNYWIDSINPLTWFYTLYQLNQYQPDVVILQWWTSFFAPLCGLVGVWNWTRNLFATKKITPKKNTLVILCHNVLPHETRWWDPLVATCAIGLGHRYLVQSESERIRLHSFLPNAHSVVVPHPEYDTLADLRLPRAEARATLDIPDDVYVLLFFGIVRQYKGLKDLLHALSHLRDMQGVQPFCLLIAGEFWDEKQPYLDIIETHTLGDLVVIDDRYIPKERVALYFSAADLLVAPYLYETGSAVLGMANGFGLRAVSSADIAQSQDSRPQAIAHAIQRAMQAQADTEATLQDEQMSWEYIKQTWEPTIQAILG